MNDASSDDAEVERCKAEAHAALKALVNILQTAAGIDEKREKLKDAYTREVRCGDCIGRRSVEAFDQNARSARTVNMADTSLNFLVHLVKFFTVVRARQAELGFGAQAFAPSPASFSNMQRLVALYYKDRVEELKKSFHDLNLPSNGFDRPFPMPPESTPSVPKWFPIAGVIFGALTLLFFMALVGASLFGYQVPPDSRFLVVVVLAFGAALSVSFLGGNAAAEGKIPIPFFKDHPIAFSATGGVAILIIVLLIGYWTYVRPGGSKAITSLGSVDLKESTNWDYDSVLVPANTVIQTNGNDLFMHAKGDLTIEDDAIVRAFDYEAINENQALPVSVAPGRDGLGYTGSASGTGAEGRDGKNGEVGHDGANGLPGKSAGKIKIVVDGKARGKLRVLNRGTDGQHGADGGAGGKGGNGEGGGPGSGSSLSYPGGRHMGSGGKGGDGAKGGNAGRGGDAGSGGSVTISVAHNDRFILKELDVSGGKAGPNGSPGPGGSPGRAGGGHGNRGAGNSGDAGSLANSSAKDGKPGKVELHGVDSPK